MSSATLKLWKETKIGSRISGNIVSPRDEPNKILSYLHEARTATTEEISQHTGIPINIVKNILNRLRKQRYVIDMSDSRDF